MHTAIWIVTLATALPLLPLTGCQDNPASARDRHLASMDGGTPTVTPDAQGPDAQTNVPTKIPPVTIARNPLGTACTAPNDCASGFCADGHCCDSPCHEQCYACNLEAAAGHCAALTSGEDPSATPACVTPAACFLPAASSVPACKLVEGTTCQADADCMSNHCLTYYVDADGDGYGTAQQADFCGELNAPAPAGYAAYSGDCCDLDSGANPAFDSAQFLQMPDACGSFDWNCNGVVAPEHSCATGMPACGEACVLNLFGPIVLFTQACN